MINTIPANLPRDFPPSNRLVAMPETKQPSLLAENSTNNNFSFDYIRKNYPHWFNYVTVILHTLGAILPFVSICPKKFSAGIRKFAIAFSRFGLPLVKLHTGIEAFIGKRLFEGIARLAPTLFLPILPFFNFQLAYGLSSGVNVVLEHLNLIIGELSHKDSFETNNNKVLNGVKQMFEIICKPTSTVSDRIKYSLALGGGSLMIGGAIPALIFAKDSLDSIPAKIFGSIRTLGGFLGDLSIMIFSTKKQSEERQKEKLVGSFYLIPTIMDFAQRFIPQKSEANEIFNHAKTALNTIADVLWSSFSTDRNIKQEQEEKDLHKPRIQEQETKPSSRLQQESLLYHQSV